MQIVLSRIFQDSPLKIGSIIHLDERATHYLAKVLRAKIGDEFQLFNGDGQTEALVQIKKIEKRAVIVEVKSLLSRDVESPLNICLAQGIARGEKMDFIVQKAVELGVNKIVPLITERSTVKLVADRKEAKISHWQAVAMSACEQSGRNKIPEICAPLTLPAWLETVQSELRFVLTPHQGKGLKMVQDKGRTATLLIGPEGGLSESEIENAFTHKFLSLNLGPRVLRTETATITAISLLQSRFGDIG